MAKKFARTHTHTHIHTHTHTHTHTKNFITRSITNYVFFTVRTTIGTHQNPPKTWQNRLKNPLKPIVSLEKTVFYTKNNQK